MGDTSKRIDEIRAGASPAENELIDGYMERRLSRREFIRRGSIAGMSLPVLGFIAACGDAEGDATTTTAAGGSDTTAAGTDTTTTQPMSEEPVTIRMGINNPAGVIDPVLINDLGRIQFISLFADTLTFSSATGLRPAIAESWESNEDGTQWTFTLREGLTYSDGTPITAADVVASFEGIAEGNAASALGTGALSPGGTVAVDDRTVQFNLDAPVGAFPFIVSSDNYNAVILPTSFWDTYAEGSYEGSFIGSGPFMVEDFTPGQGAVLVRNENYWGPTAVPDRVEVTFFADESAMIAAFQEGRLDVIPSFSAANGQALLNDPNTQVGVIPTAEHRQIHMNTQEGLFADKRVRQALALAVNRQSMVDGLLSGFGDLANDHPIAPFFAVFNPGAVAQKEEDLATANALIDEAGVRGAEVTLNTLQFAELELLAQLIQGAGAQIGLTINLQIDDAGTYYDAYWLDSTLGITNYGHRGVPNVYLGAPLKSDGTWNSAKFNNAEYDALVDAFVAEPDEDAQRELAGEIQALLADEVPMIIPYFLGNISATRPNTVGLETTGMGHVIITELILGG
ncbi:MAG: ABC transporter substrate-binding protein [Acidimicrobiia bacterium]